MPDLRYLSLLGLVFAASCTVGPDYKRPEFYGNAKLGKNLALEPATAHPVYRDWYRQFNDPVMNRLIDEALRQSPNVKIATHKLREARYALLVSNVNNFPMINADASYHYDKSSKDIGFSIDRDYYQTGLDASWELDIWGGGRRQREAARAVFEAAGANLNNVKLVMASEIANNYIALRTAQEQLRVAEDNLKLQEDIYEMVASRHKAGLTDDIALNQARYAVESTKTLIPTLAYNAEAYKNALSVLVGVLPDDLSADLAPQQRNLIRRRFTWHLDELYNLPVEVIRTRPDVMISEQNLIAQNAALGEAIANLYPNVSISGFVGWQAGKIPGLINGSHSTYSYAPAINLPLFHWGQLMNTVKQQKEVKEQYVYQYQNAILNAVSEIKNSVTSIQQEHKRNQAYEESVRSMKKVLTYTLSKYKNGLVNFTDLLDAEQALLKAQTELLASNGQLYQSLVAFYKASGGGFNEKYQVCDQRSLLLNGTSCKIR